MDDPNMHAYGDHYPDDSEVPGAHPPPNHPLSRLAARLGELLDEDQWPECETLLLQGWQRDAIDRKTGADWRQNLEQAAQICNETLASIEGGLCAEAIGNLKEIPNETQTIPASLD